MSNRVFVFIEGADFTESVGGLDNFAITYRKNGKDQTVTVALSNSLTFFGRAYDLLFDRFFNAAPNTKLEPVKVTVQPECCPVQFPFKLTFESVELCAHECEIKGTLQSDTPETDAYRCLNNTIFWKNGFDRLEHPRVQYCADFDFISAVVGYLYYVLQPTVRAVQLIFKVLNYISFGAIPNLDKPLQDLENFITGCGRYHIAPLVKEIFEFNCKRCGVRFNSSIFNRPNYANTMLLQAQYERGYDIGGAGWQPGNAANLTTLQLAEMLKPVFAADYEIADGQLTFERTDYFESRGVFLVNVETAYADGRAKDGPCYNYKQLQNFAYGRFAYTLDAIDTAGNEAAELYNDIVEWNKNPANDTQSGEYTNNVQFSPARFMRDRKNSDFVDTLRENLPLFSSQKHENELVLGMSKSSFLKLLIWDGSSSRRNAKVLRRRVAPNTYDYNYPLFFDENYVQPELYQNFHFIRNPRLNPRRGLELKDFSFVFTCEDVAKVAQNLLNLQVETRFGHGKPEAVEINFSTGLLKVTNVYV